MCHAQQRRYARRARAGCERTPVCRQRMNARVRAQHSAANSSSSSSSAHFPNAITFFCSVLTSCLGLSACLDGSTSSWHSLCISCNVFVVDGAGRITAAMAVLFVATFLLSSASSLPYSDAQLRRYDSIDNFSTSTAVIIRH